MNPGFIFLLLLVGAPLLELYVLIEVGSEIGALPTILLSIFTAILGAALVRLQGVSVLLRVQETLARGEAPALEMLEGAVLMMAGVMLLFPGFITDVMGFLMLIPPLRRHLIVAVLRNSGTLRPAPPGTSRDEDPVRRVTIIQGEYRKEDD
ncbi:FxsA family protein [Thiolapillus brandeum]|uniref:FxsA cytoplasmic membrane protein n=1 Tax=Thiolapillus brandeum TaxID=1076588 RepID=A0A7U6JGI2_9GAMM|nr:FxsA family protein [Thiolapillus brandeum]BAO42967.1 FxsA cytoplasmic membrane protein [Thiolapillus brandeum]